MARSRRTSATLEMSRQRLAGAKTIHPAPTFSPTLTVESFEAKANAFAARLNGYNQQVAALDTEQNGIDADENELKDLNRRLLSSVEAQYGPDSSEYEACGGTRKSEQKRRKQKGNNVPAPPKA